MRLGKNNRSGFRGSLETPSSRTAILVAFAFMLVIAATIALPSSLD